MSKYGANYEQECRERKEPVDEGAREADRMREQATQEHDLDEDCVCNRCGFDAAEWWHLERIKPREERERQPECSVQSQTDKHPDT